MTKLYSFPLKMHIGAPDVPVVKVGQEVKKRGMNCRTKWSWSENTY